MIALLCILFVALVVCFVVIYRASQENYDLHAALVERDIQVHHISERNRALNAALAESTYTTRTITASTSQPVTLAPEHPQKRKPKSIRGKRK
tara:strand:+ start:2599 stop:2877 length:279 start_codon:yes stop_codon:yes gene_type:complete